MTIKKDFTGQVFGRLTILGDAPSKPQKRRVFVRCSCGTEKEVGLYKVTSGNVASCGCLNKEAVTTHGETKTDLYHVWASMKQRCYDPKHQAFPDYGGRGIVVCDGWLQYESFREWALSTGYTPELTIDREDNNRNYEPSNCRWTTRVIQATNRRKKSGTASKYIGVSKWSSKGKTGWAARISVNKKSLYLGIFATELEAAQAREAYIDAHGLTDFTRNNI